MAKTTCKLTLVNSQFRALFPTEQHLRVFLNRIKAMPRESNVQPPKLPEDFGLFWKDNSYSLIYYIKDEGSLVTRHISLKTESVYEARAMRDSVIAATGTSERKFAASGLRGARWVADNPYGMEGVRVTVRINGPERQRIFKASGDNCATVVEKALEWRRKAAKDYIKKNA